MSLTARIRVRTYELDSFGHVNNAVYLQYFEVARDDYLRQMGLSFDDFARTQSQFVITEARVRYLSSARYGDTLEVVGEIAELGPASTLFTYRVLSNAVLLATGETRGAFLSAASGRPIRIPEPFKSAFLAQHKRDQQDKADREGTSRSASDET